MLPLFANKTMARNLIFGEVLDERRRQLAKWGPQSHPHKVMIGDIPRHWEHECMVAKTNCQDKSDEEVTWEDILWEEVTEAFCEEEWDLRRAELIQVMAVCLAEIEDGDEKNAATGGVIDEELAQTGEQSGWVISGTLTRVSEPGHPGDSEQNSAGGSF